MASQSVGHAAGASANPPISSQTPPTPGTDANVHERSSNQVTNIDSLRVSSEPLRRCWICQMDEDEDSPGGSGWKRPCPCSLTAHNECLLEWVADVEAPSDDSIHTQRKIECPVCKAPIKIERPRDVLVELFDHTQSIARTAAYPIGIVSIVGCAYAGLVGYGINALFLVFGSKDSVDILRAMVRPPQGVQEVGIDPRGLVNTMRDIFTGQNRSFPRFQVVGWKPYLLLPMIAPTLWLSRSPLGDYILPLSLSVYFINPSHRDIYNWPPSPGLTFAALPYLRNTYNGLYRFAFADLEKKWALAVQRKPRDGETAEGIAVAANDNGEDNLFGIEIIEEQIEGPGDDAELPIAQVDGAANPAPIDRHRHERIFFDQNWSIAQLILSMTGALSFPLISSVMGALLEIVLPGRLVGHGLGSTRINGTGILQQKWGRSVAGGCLFVVLKDAVTLYVKWRKAKNFGKKKIMDYQGPRAEASRAHSRNLG